MKHQKHTLMTVFLFLSLLCLSLTIFLPETVQAADSPAAITSCKVSKNKKNVLVKAKITQKDSSYGKKLYLLAVDSQTSEKKAIKAVPLAAKANKKGTLSFKVKYKENMLFQKFAIAYKTKSKYKIISNTYYITNPEVFSTYNGSGPKTTSKKGLQPENFSEALELRTQHAVINWTVDSLLTTNCTNTIPYTYRGSTYYFNADMLSHNDAQVKAYNEAGAKVSVILLLPNSTNPQTDAMRYTGADSAQYSSFKVSTKKGCRTFEALMSFLAARYGIKEQYVAGWILGNEVNNPYEWNYGGDKNLTTYMEQYSRAFHIAYNAVRSVSKKSNVYISLDHSWNFDADNSGKRYFSAKSVLDEFYRQVNLRGKVPFQIAYHAYPQGLIDPVFWDDSLAVNSIDSTYITFRNINVLTDYVKNNFGKKYTIMLSEQAFNSTKGEAVQAAAYAYAYYLSECNDMIESFIYSRQFDHPIEMADDCYWGLCDQAGTKRIVWHVFQNIDSASSFQFTKQLVKYTDLSAWKKIKGFKKAKFTNMEAINRTPTLGNVKMDDTNTVALFWNQVKYVDGYEIYRNEQKIDTLMDASVTGYIDKNISSGEEYTYTIRSFKFTPGTKDANEKGALFSSHSNALSITASTGKAAWNPEKCSVNGKNITLGWTAQKGTAGYEVERADTPEGTYTLIADTTKKTFTDKNTVSGTTYYYKVRAYVTKDSIKYYGNYSDVLSMQANIQLAAAISDGTLSLSWSQLPNALKYQIYCSSDADESFSKIKTTRDGTIFSCQFTNDDYSFAAGETYHFKVRAILPDGSRSAYSNVADLLISEALLSENAIAPQAEVFMEESEENLETETENSENPSENFEPDNADTESPETDDFDNSESSDMNDFDIEIPDTEDTKPAESDTQISDTDCSDTEDAKPAESDTETSNSGFSETESSEMDDSDTAISKTEASASAFCDTEDAETITM